MSEKLIHFTIFSHSNNDNQQKIPRTKANKTNKFV